MSPAVRCLLAALLAGAAASGSSVTANATQLPPEPAPAGPTAAAAGSSGLVPSTKDPYRQLFRIAPESSRVRPASAQVQPPRRNAPRSPAAQAQPDVKIVCGMTVHRVSPDLDPKMVKKPSAAEQAGFAIRRIPPDTCIE